MLESPSTPPSSREEIFSRVRRALFQFLVRRHSPELAEDITQRVFVVLLSRYTGKEGESDLLPLAIRCAQYIQLEEGRIPMRFQQPPEGEWNPTSNELNPEEQLLRKSYLERLYRAIPLLKDRCRNIIQQRLLGHETSQIAESLQTNSATLHVWEFRCRGNLQQLLGVRT